MDDPDSILKWIGIVFCVSQSAMFSGLNLALFSIPRLELEILAKKGNAAAGKVLFLRKDAHLLLATILWGNVGINVLLTLLTDSVMAGAAGFLFSTVIITLFGEILPQAYFSRNALAYGAKLYPVIQFYKMLLYPVAKPAALVLHKLLGAETLQFYKEQDLVHLIQEHLQSHEADDISNLEGRGAINFLKLDDIPVNDEGENIAPDSILQFPFAGTFPTLPEFEYTSDDPFIRQIQSSGMKWVILTDEEDQPRLILDADGFLREALCEPEPRNILSFCHKPIIVNDPTEDLGTALSLLERDPDHHQDDVIDKDVVILWTPYVRKIITGADILGRLLRGISPIKK